MVDEKYYIVELSDYTISKLNKEKKHDEETYDDIIIRLIKKYNEIHR